MIPGFSLDGTPKSILSLSKTEAALKSFHASQCVHKTLLLCINKENKNKKICVHPTQGKKGMLIRAENRACSVFCS